MSDLFKFALIVVVIYLVFTNLSPDAQSKISNFFGGIKDKAVDAFSNKSITQEPYKEGDKIVLGPVYQEVSCVSDLECQEWYSCSACQCDQVTGQCWYD